MMMFSMNDMVPQNHMLRLIDRAINWNFIYDLVEEKYCPDNGRPSMDPVMLIKIPFIHGKHHHLFSFLSAFLVIIKKHRPSDIYYIRKAAPTIAKPCKSRALSTV